MSSRMTRLKSEKYNANILKRGSTDAKPKEKASVDGKIKEDKDERKLSPLIIFVCIIMFGSVVVGVLEALKRKL